MDAAAGSDAFVAEGITEYPLLAEGGLVGDDGVHVLHDFLFIIPAVVLLPTFM